MTGMNTIVRIVLTVRPPMIVTAIGPNMLSHISGIIPRTVVTADIATGLSLLTPVSTIER